MGKVKDAAKPKNLALFDILLIVELQQDQGGKTTPFISYRYPQFEQSFDAVKDPFSSSVTQFCFPDINQFPTETMESESFSFVLTEGDGERRFGYCVRKLHPGHGPRYPVAFSIMAFFPCFTLYTKILEEVAYHYENTSLRMLSDFLCTVLAHPFPLPGKSFEVQIGNVKNSTTDLKFTRPDDSDSQIDYVDLDSLLLVMNDRNILTIFASMLIERRIIFCSSKLSTLSSCVQTAVALLYPLSWQHIYIPVLPKSLLSFCCAPMPFVVGILASELNEVLMLPMDEVLIINLDDDSFIRTPDPDKNDIDILPPNSSNILRKSIRNTCKKIKKYQKKKLKTEKGGRTDEDLMTDKLMEYELKKQKRELKENFLQFFVYALGSYKSYISGDHFDREKLIADQSPDTRQLMELLVGSQMFERFIEERIHTQISSGGFERAVSRYEKIAEITQTHFDDSSSNSNNNDLLRGSKRAPKKVLEGLRSIRGLISKSEEPTGNDFVLSTPTLVQSTNDRITSIEIHEYTPSKLSLSGNIPNKPPPLPPKPTSVLTKMVVPSKALPPPPKPPTQNNTNNTNNAINNTINNNNNANNENTVSNVEESKNAPSLRGRALLRGSGNARIETTKYINNNNNNNINNNNVNNNNNNNNEIQSTIQQSPTRGGMRGGRELPKPDSFNRSASEITLSNIPPPLPNRPAGNNAVGTGAPSGSVTSNNAGNNNANNAGTLRTRRPAPVARGAASNNRGTVSTLRNRPLPEPPV